MAGGWVGIHMRLPWGFGRSVVACPENFSDDYCHLLCGCSNVFVGKIVPSMGRI